MTLKVVPKAACDSEIVHWRKSTNDCKGNPEQKF
jgi:hypothetical protein